MEILAEWLHRIAVRTRPVGYAIRSHETGHEVFYPNYNEAEDEAVRLARSPDRPVFDFESIHFLFGREYRKQGIIRA